MLLKENPRRYIEYIIHNDSNIRCMIDMFNESLLKALEMYVGVDVASTSTTLVEIRGMTRPEILQKANIKWKLNFHMLIMMSKKQKHFVDQLLELILIYEGVEIHVCR
ncbi:unnamed protein product [Lupinus luteus]|uniref:Uncharacterized protein n=1 Tax=Lupinus luteus TaxID=3873 RepID=A0AAV1W3U4_LUPLU